MQGTVPFAANDAIDQTQKLALLRFLETPFPVHVVQDAVQVEAHSPDRVIAVPGSLLMGVLAGNEQTCLANGLTRIIDHLLQEERGSGVRSRRE